MTSVSKNGATLQVVTQGPVIVNFDILRGRIKVDQGNSPYVEGEVVVSAPDALTLSLLDPRKLPQCIVYPTEDGWLNGAFVLSLRSRRIESGEVVLSVASFESLLLDYAPLADDYTPLTLASSLRAIVNYVLGVAKPSLVVLPWALSASPAHDADMTPVWSVINLPGNSGFEGNTTAGYVAAVNVSGLTITTAVGFVKHGTRALRYTATAAGNSRLDIGASNQAFRATPGRTYTVAIEHRSSIARSAILGVRFVNGDGDTIGSATADFTSSASQLDRQRLTATAPAGTEYIWPYILTIGNSAGQFHYLDDVMIVEGEFLPDFFDGSTTDTATYDYAWAGATNASQSIRTALVDGVAPDALVWRAGVSALDFLLPLVQAAGLRLVNQGTSWTLRDENYTASGSSVIGYGVNMVDGVEVIDRDAGAWADAQVTKYSWTDRDGIQREAVDAYAIDPDYNLLTVEERSTPYPGPGYSEYAVRRAQQRGREVTVTAVTDWSTTAEQPITVTLDGGAELEGVIQSVEFDLETDEMHITVRPDEETP